MPSSSGEISTYSQYNADNLDAAVLLIALSAVAANFEDLQVKSSSAHCAAVVKANAYGLGVGRIAPALARAGCRDFFVAHVREGIELREILGPDPSIAILHGLPAGSEATFVAHNLVPVVNDRAQLEAWRSHAHTEARSLPTMLQVDTGMSRFGFPPDELLQLAARDGFFAGLDLKLVMSHLACADNPVHEANLQQLAVLAGVRAAFPHVPASIAASSGIFLDPSFHLDLVRPGAALFGVSPQAKSPNPMRPVIRLQARVEQIRTVPTGTSVGYGYSATTERPSRLATVGIGYADGFFRSAFGKAEASFEGSALPLIGRVSMDSVILDITEVEADAITCGSLVDIIGPHRDLDAVANAAGTIGYEVLTNLGHRFTRKYISN